MIQGDPHTDSQTCVAGLVRQFLSISPEDQQSFLSQVSAKPCDVIYSEEVLTMLGLDRLKHPRMALQRLFHSGDLTQRKLGGRLVFYRPDIERLIKTGATSRRRGRPAGSKNREKI